MVLFLVYPYTTSCPTFFLFFFSLLFVVPPLILFNIRKKSSAVSLCGFFSPHEYIFWVKHFQFLLVIFSYLIQGGIWNTQVFLSDIVSLALSVAAVIECGFPSFPEPHVQTQVLHFHIYTHKKVTHLTAAHPLVSALTPLANCHRHKPHPPLTQSEATHWDKTSKRKDEFWSVFI